ncbi:MAG: type II toxin-antitoxin system VapC family toxin, partial [Anaerolineae bacterium]|nr:type II toxin-antitoxin system VapC family toxin [Anaerolineae bacterium]
QKHAKVYRKPRPHLSYYVEENPTYLDKMDAIIKQVEETSIEVVSSVITLTEVLNHPIKQGNSQLEQEYRDILVNSSDYRLLPITLTIAESAANLRARYNLRTPDALHVATAIEAQCDAFLTNDLGIKRVSEITILLLDELDLTEEY